MAAKAEAEREAAERAAAAGEEVEARAPAVPVRVVAAVPADVPVAGQVVAVGD